MRRFDLSADLDTIVAAIFGRIRGPRIGDFYEFAVGALAYTI
jgi:hypothetical protein